MNSIARRERELEVRRERVVRVKNKREERLPHFPLNAWTLPYLEMPHLPRSYPLTPRCPVQEQNAGEESNHRNLQDGVFAPGNLRHGDVLVSQLIQ